MAKKTDEAQSAKAARLREEIEKIKRQADGAPLGPSQAASPGKLPSPREFIHKRMRELKERK